MYKVVYHLTDGSVVGVELNKYSKENIGQFILGTEHAISTNGATRVQKRTPLGYSEIISISTKCITQVEYINLDDRVTENN